MLNSEFKKNAPIFWPRGVFLFFSLVILDLVSKHFAKNIFRNYVFAFSLPLNIGFIYAIYFAVVFGIIFYIIKNYRKFSFFSKVSWLLIFTGAFLNIYERLMLGYVRDFIYITFFKWTGIYNFPDFYIILGITFLLIFSKEEI